MYIDCPTCGQTEHESKFHTCSRCRQYICKWCRDNTHACVDVYSDEYEVEVIGNIHENPELLKEQQ